MVVDKMGLYHKTIGSAFSELFIEKKEKLGSADDQTEYQSFFARAT
jgi:hypothetical protein